MAFALKFFGARHLATLHGKTIFLVFDQSTHRQNVRALELTPPRFSRLNRCFADTDLASGFLGTPSEGFAEVDKFFEHNDVMVFELEKSPRSSVAWMTGGLCVQCSPSRRFAVPLPGESGHPPICRCERRADHSGGGRRRKPHHTQHADRQRCIGCCGRSTER